MDAGVIIGAAVGGVAVWFFALAACFYAMTIFKKSRIRERYRSAADQERQEVERAARAEVGAAVAASQRTEEEDRADHK